MSTLDFDDVPTRPVELDSLDEYQNIRDFINDSWGTIRLKDYLDNLLADTSNHTRRGFPAHVGDTLLKLSLANIELLESMGYNFDDSHVSQFAQTGWALPKNF